MITLVCSQPTKYLQTASTKTHLGFAARPRTGVAGSQTSLGLHVFHYFAEAKAKIIECIDDSEHQGMMKQT